jgi:hypothetical protein
VDVRSSDKQRRPRIERRQVSAESGDARNGRCSDSEESRNANFNDSRHPSARNPQKQHYQHRLHEGSDHQ